MNAVPPVVEAVFSVDGGAGLAAGLSAERSREAVVLFPGFPGFAPAPGAFAGPPKMRVELAKAVLGACGFDCFLPGYGGLAPAGSFRFERAVEDGITLTRALAACGYERVHVAGHSFGAFVAFNAHRSLGARAGRLSLISGLLDLPDEAAVRAFLPYYFEHFPRVLGAGPEAFERSVADLDRARHVGNPLTAARPMSGGDLLIVHGLRDAEVSPELSRRFHAKAGGRLELLVADHGWNGSLAPLSALLAEFLAAR